MKHINTIIILYLFSLFGILASCEDNDIQTDIDTVTKSDEYWYTRTRTEQQQQVMLRYFGLGFSYDAIYGEKCDVNSVRCQVLNVNELNEALFESHLNSLSFNYSSSHSFGEYCHNANMKTKLDENFIIYQKSYQKTASIFEHYDTQGLCVTNEIEIPKNIRAINMEDIPELIKSEPKKYLSENFLYALDKIKKYGKDNVAVVDSFINIFGTHVVTQATAGARLKIDFASEEKIAKSYIEEKTITEKSLDVYFKKTASTLTENDAKIIDSFFENSEIHIDVKGGDLSYLSEILINPKSYPSDSLILKNWMNSVKWSDSDVWSSNCEMEDMEVSPIWLFIPDDDVAALVQSRIVATAPTMQELFGNLNYINVCFDPDQRRVYYRFSGGYYTKSGYGYYPCNIVLAAHRYVAIICREWVPEIDPYNAVLVVYPIYENHIQEQSAVAIHNNKVYRLRWCYNQFVIEEIIDEVYNNKLYLNCGYFELTPNDKMDYQPVTVTCDYEWPGSILPDGSVAKPKVYRTRRFLGNFYLNTDMEFSNIPNWSYTTSDNYNSNYDKWLKDLGDLPYEVSKIKLDGRSGKENTTNRMIRNDDYSYIINGSELKL